MRKINVFASVLISRAPAERGLDFLLIECEILVDLRTVL
jgi:hypothetical protein